MPGGDTMTGVLECRIEAKDLWPEKVAAKKKTFWNDFTQESVVQPEFNHTHQVTVHVELLFA